MNQKPQMHAQSSQQPRQKAGQEVVVTDVDISFGNMVMLLVKLAFAAIPAMFIIWFFWAVFAFIMMAVLGVGGSILSGI